MYFIDGDIDRPNSIFAPFKLVDWAILNTSEVSDLAQKLKMVDKAWLCINELFISTDDIEILFKSFGDRLRSLKANKLEILKVSNEEISYEAVEALNLINPCTLYFKNFDWSYDTFKMLFSLNSENIEAKFDSCSSKSHILNFTEVNLVMFDSKQNRSMKLMCRSTIIEVAEKYFTEFCLLKADKYKFSNSDCFFIPFASILKLKIIENMVDKSSTKNENQLAPINEDIDVLQGLIIPVNQLSLATFYSSFWFINSCKENLIVANELLRKAREVNWICDDLNEITELENIFQDDFYRIKFSLNSVIFLNQRKNQEIELTDIELISPTFSYIMNDKTIFEDDLKIIWNLLSSRRTRYNITGVNLKLYLLSECLTVLSLCEKCPELNSISLKFYKWDVSDEKEAINRAIKKFRRNFGFIQFIEIYES